MSKSRIQEILKSKYNVPDIISLEQDKDEIIRKIEKYQRERDNIDYKIKTYKTPLDDYNRKRNMRILDNMSKHTWKTKYEDYMFMFYVERWHHAKYYNDTSYKVYHLIFVRMSEDGEINGVYRINYKQTHSELKNSLAMWLRNYKLQSIRTTKKMRKVKKIVKQTILKADKSY